MGSDVAELLMRDTMSTCGELADGESLIDLNESPTPGKENLNIADLLTGYPPTDKEATEQNLQNYTKLLLSGRKKVNFSEQYFSHLLYYFYVNDPVTFFGQLIFFSLLTFSIKNGLGH